MVDYAKLLEMYEMNVQFPNMRTLEHLDILCMRSEIAKVISCLTVEQYARLIEADQMLLSQARPFYQAIQKNGNLADWRHDNDVPDSQWWWHLDSLI